MIGGERVVRFAPPCDATRSARCTERMASMKSEELQDNMLSTYFWLRGGIVFLSVALPLILYFGGRFRADLPLLTR